MTISQLTSSQGSSRSRTSLWHRALRAVVRWQDRRRASADLIRLAQVGDYLLRDVGLDPKLARENPAALVGQVMHRD